MSQPQVDAVTGALLTGVLGKRELLQLQFQLKWVTFTVTWKVLLTAV